MAWVNCPGKPHLSSFERYLIEPGLERYGDDTNTCSLESISVRTRTNMIPCNSQHCSMSIFDIFAIQCTSSGANGLGATLGEISILQLQLLGIHLTKTSHWIGRLAIFVNAIRSFITKTQSPRNIVIIRYMVSESHIGDVVFSLGVQPTGTPVF